MIGISLPVLSQSVTGVRIGTQPNKTRFVLDISEKIDFSVFTLADPYRIVVDLPALEWEIPRDNDAQDKGLIKRYRFGPFDVGSSRVVLDATQPVEVTGAFLLPPQGRYNYRFVIDLRPIDRNTFLKILKANRGTRTTVVHTPTPSKAPVFQKNGRRTIMIDAGHGGVDPGANGSIGPAEKEITLKVARELHKSLSGSKRYRVLLTRDGDVFLSLNERVRRTRQAHADLFLSIHADSIGDRRVRGATIYTLSETASDREAAALAAKENKADVIAGIDLAGESDEVMNILIDLAQRETMNYSARMANLLIPEIGKSMPLRRNSHRFAGFRVLKAPDVPSVLVEMGYLSNRQDALFLNSAAGRKKIAAALQRAVEAYFANFASQ